MAVGFLTEMVRAVRAEVREKAYAEDLPTTRPERPPSLRRALDSQARRGALLVEFKRASPGQANPDLPPRSPDEFVAAVDPADPAGYSCLATRHRFRGSPKDVRAMVDATRRPVLFKEFVLDPISVDVAARCGVSAILLIARLETEERFGTTLAPLAQRAHELGLEVLLEFHRPAELRLVDRVPADVYGVNARDLDTLSFDRAVADGTVREAARLGLRPLLGLSGVEGPAEARRLWDAGADGLLVGTAVARAPDPVRFLERLRKERQDGGDP